MKMDDCKSVHTILKAKFIKPIKDVRSIWLETLTSFKADEDDLQNILSFLKAGLITFKPNNVEDTGNETTEIEMNDTMTQKKKRGRPTKLSKLEDDENSLFESSDGLSSNDSNCSVSSSRSRRAAAQMAGQKLAQVQNFIKTKKLRRPTDYNEKLSKQDNVVCSPPAKSRRTRRKQSAGSHEDIEANDINETNDKSIQNAISTKNCTVNVSRLEVEDINNHLTGKNSNESNRNSVDCFQESPIHPNKNITRDESFGIVLTGQSTNDLDSNQQKNKPRNKKDADSGISSNEEEIQKMELGNIPAAQSSPIDRPDLEYNPVDGNSDEAHGLDVTYVKQNKDNKTNNDKLNNTKVISTNSNCNVLNQNKDNVEKDSSSSENETSDTRSRTKVIRKDEVQSNDSEKRGEQIKVVKNEDERKLNSESPERIIRSRTKTIRKHVANESPEDTLKENVVNCVNESKKETVKKLDNDLFSPVLPASGKRDIVKKRVEDFEKMKSVVDESGEEKVTRVTRNAAKNKNAPSTETQSIKQSRNVPYHKVTSKLQASEKLRLTPLAPSNRMTPGPDSASKTPAANKTGSVINRQNQNENSSTIQVQRQAVEEAEKKRREEEILRRKAKEEEAKKKKEKTLKATAEETRRKREEKLQKVAATREAAEREKALLTEKAEKEKEEKIRQIAAEKQKQKEEQLKKRLLMQQKTLEHEERRKQDEAARLAKLKEQEEEHKRQIAMKEREQEMLKQQKAAEMRSAEAEKTKNQGVKTTKIPGLNGKLKQEGTAISSTLKQEVQSYNITPARDERPLLKPKTENDYGIDDALSEDSSEDESRPKKIIPLWAQSKNRDRLLLVNNLLPKKIWSLFMEADPCPDINQIFAGNPIMKRTRTSSAVWRTPPSYSHFKNK